MPTPKDVLGHHIGAPKKLTRTAEHALTATTAALEQAKAPRVKVITIGKTDEGRELNIIVVALGGVDPQPRPLPRRISGSSPTRARLTEAQAQGDHRAGPNRSIT